MPTIQKSDLKLFQKAIFCGFLIYVSRKIFFTIWYLVDDYINSYQFVLSEFITSFTRGLGEHLTLYELIDIVLITPLIENVIFVIIFLPFWCLIKIERLRSKNSLTIMFGLYLIVSSFTWGLFHSFDFDGYIFWSRIVSGFVQGIFFVYIFTKSKSLFKGYLFTAQAHSIYNLIIILVQEISSF